MLWTELMKPKCDLRLQASPGPLCDLEVVHHFKNSFKDKGGIFFDLKSFEFHDITLWPNGPSLLLSKCLSAS